MRKWIVQGVIPIVSGLALLLGVMAVGRAARVSLHEQLNYSLAFADIDCQPPEGMSRSAFLDEVHSLAVQPAALHLLDDELSARLHRAFLTHPWVESVRRVAIGQASVQVEMEYRIAVLAVPPAEGGWRRVDRRGILLPESATQPHLPVLITNVATPVGPIGSRWGDARVAAAAKTAAFLQPQLARLQLEGSQIEINEGEIVFIKPGVRIVWGHAPGQEKEDEALAQEKLRRLLAYQKEHDGLDSLEHDVRLLAYQGHFPLTTDEPLNTVSFDESTLSPLDRNRNPVSNSSRSWRSCFNEARPPSVSASSR